ncbi:TPA: hypothetical protein P0E22_000304 [Vibrio harveyi]|nr:hypothetical protein [Vibrio harveyi]
MLKTKLMLLISGVFISTSCFSANNMTSEDPTIDKQITEENTHEERTLACEEEPCGTKGFDSRLLLENEPTKQVLSSIESISKTLNAMSVLMFAGDKS